MTESIPTKPEKLCSLGRAFFRVPRSRLSASEISVHGKSFVSYEPNVTCHIILTTTRDLACKLVGIFSHINRHYTIIRVRSAFSLVATCVLLKYTRTDDVN